MIVSGRDGMLGNHALPAVAVAQRKGSVTEFTRRSLLERIARRIVRRFRLVAPFLVQLTAKFQSGRNGAIVLRIAVEGRGLAS